MFSEAEYINGWLAYSAGVIIGLWCWWYLLYKLPLKYLRPSLFAAMAAMLTMPWPAMENSGFLAPAWIIAAAEGIFDGLEAFWRAGTPALTATVLGAIIGGGIQVAYMIIKGSDKKAESLNAKNSEISNA